MEILGKMAEQAWIKYICSKPNTLSEFEKSILQQSKNQSIVNIANPLPRMFRFQSSVHPTANLYSSLPFDRLHTLYKGLVEFILCWICCVIIRISSLDQKKYRYSMSSIDSAIQNFPRHHSLSVFGNFLFHAGITNHISVDMSVNSMASAYMMTGSLEAYKIPQLLFQLLLCIGVKGTIIPNTQQWCIDNKIGGKVKYNPTAVVLKAGFMVLELVLFYKVTSITTLNLKHLQQLILSTQEHANILQDLLQALCKNNKFSLSLKPHAICHNFAQVQREGVAANTDTASQEHSHHETAVVSFHSSSKRLKSRNNEMINHVVEQKMTRHLQKRVKLEDAENFKTNKLLQKVYDNHSSNLKSNLKTSAFETSYARIDHLGKVVLVFDTANNTWISKDSKSIISHPLLTSAIFDELLSSYADNREEIWNFEATSAVKILMTTPTTCTKYRLQLESGIKILPSADSGIEDFLIYATSKYVTERGHEHKQISYLKRYDSVEMSDNDYYQIMAIISIIQIDEGVESLLENLIITTEYSVVAKTRESKYLPYLELEFKYTRGHKQITICETEMINRPLCVVPFVENRSIIYSKDTALQRSIRFWAFNLKFVDRSLWQDFTAVTSALPALDTTELPFLINDARRILLMQARQAVQFENDINNEEDMFENDVGDDSNI